MAYSTDDIAVARSLQFLSYIYVYFTPNENTGKCRELENIESGLGIVLVIVSESISRPFVLSFFILRTYVLWNRNRILLAAMVCTSFMQLAQSRESQGAPGVHPVSSPSYHFFSFPCSKWVFSPGLMILTLIRAVQNWRMNSSRMYGVLVSHNISYYACGFVLSVTNILISLLLQFIMLVILATRMHLHLWEVNRHPNDTTSTLVPMSNMSFANDAVPLTDHFV
ncbi:uncharacterized protein F5891DRAFT_980916 [Suillus fuscotomentosus]|uniref:Uncharacterized protein n=1 Tax=Suillus fuscotomentosus TaxID=1912939 RepID=A0AAD4E4R0_9AGAM|nr:uncharacterized protein F5891DRAFT_980916 [Suillus fuscotomentosus]KAG1899680.1 hypothetical protein F5891DRAFT_980916 [Suillus fuscotomentosus]